MKAKKIVDLALKGKAHKVKLDIELHPFANFLWDKTMKSIESIPDEMELVDLSDKALQGRINERLILLNQQCVLQKQNYKELVSELITNK